MPHRCGSSKAPTASSGDSFSAIPDDVIHHLLGFLPALDAVRTCVLARHWLTLWRYVPRLRIADVEALGSVCSLNKFVNRVLLLRESGCPLDDCEFDLRGLPFLDRVCIDQWMRHTLICHVRLLRVRVYAVERVGIADWPLLSKYLMRLELEGLVLEGSFLDFSGCLVLEDLKITNCLIDTDSILSPSLKHLKITACELCWRHIPTHISAPKLVSLQLDDYVGVTPILESMPLLETASVNLGQINEEYCDFCDKGESVDCTCDMCIIYYDDNGHRNDVCVLLGGLSSATHLELKASPKMVTFKRDLRYCPTFNKLETLLLDDCCLVDLHTLVCFLQHTPNLQKLILKLSERPKPAMEMDSSNLMEQSLMLQQPKVVKVKCQLIDERVHNILKILHSCGIKEISAQEMACK